MRCFHYKRKQYIVAGFKKTSQSVIRKDDWLLTLLV